MNIYLDIDGVLLDKNGILANHAEEFLNFMLKNHEVFWLTTHCRGGACDAIDHISVKNNLSEKLIDLLNQVKMTDWVSLKTDAIDFSQSFAWIDDYVMETEKKVLLENNALTNLHEVNINNKPELLDSLMGVHFERPEVVWQRFDFELSFSEKDFELIKKGFHSDKGMDERWRFAFYEDTLYIMRHWSAWVNYKIRFKEKNGRYFVYDSFISNLAEQDKKGEFTSFEKNYNVAFIIWLIESYLLHNKKIFFGDPTFYQTQLKISIDSIHGYSHWKKVEDTGHYIADKNGADKEVLTAFAFTHDIGRTAEFEQPGHGSESAKIIRDKFSAEYLGINDEQYNKLIVAVSEHDKSDAKSDDITIQTCWDADRLDLPRVYIFPDKKLLYTEVAKSQETFRHLGIVNIQD